MGSIARHRAALVAIVVVARAICHGAPPDRGSITFGASERPAVSLPPHLEALSSTLADIASQVIPTVVSVVPTKIDTVTFSSNPFYQFFGDPFGNPLEQFFGERRDPAPPNVQRRRYRQQGLGSGVIVSPEGYILTNYHVVAGADEIEIRMHDERVFQAQIVGTDSLSDVAVLKIREPVEGLRVAYLGDSDKIRPGDWAVAVGNPFSLTSSVTMGIISALGRTTPGGSSDAYQNFIQTDAAINPGNSGGALVNIRGELIGINTLIYTQSGGYMGIGFAIPVNMARRIMEDLIYEGSVSRGWLGAMIQELDQTARDALGLGMSLSGVLIGDIFPGQPAARAGLRRGDVVLGINGRGVGSPNQLKNAIGALHPGEKAACEILRGGKRLTIFVTLAGRRSRQETGKVQTAGGAAQGSQFDAAGQIGIVIGSITGTLREQLRIGRTQGVVILKVDPESPAASSGIREFDLVLKVNMAEIASPADFDAATKMLGPGDSVLILLMRNGDTFFKGFKIRG